MLIPTYDLDMMFTAFKDILAGKIQFNFSSQDLSDFDWEKAGKAYSRILNLDNQEKVIPST